MGSQAFAPVQLIQLRKEDFTSDDGVANINTLLAQIVKNQNLQNGSAGPTPLPSGADLKGKHIQNVGGVGPQHTAISMAFAEAHYSAEAIAPQLEAGQKNSLKSMRRVNDQNQIEYRSAWLEGMASTSPTTNNATISGSGDTVTVSAGFHLKVSGNTVPFASRTDTVALPSSVAISTLVRTSSVVLATTTGPHGLVPGNVVNIEDATDPTFDGQFVVATTPTPDTFTYAQIGPNASTTGGTASEGAIFYYFLPINRQTLSMAGPFSTDSQENRLSINKDGTVLIAVASFGGGGFNADASAAGATPPPQNSGNHVLTRL